MRHRRMTNDNVMLSKMENMISMMATEKPFERLQSLEQKINVVDKIQTIENYIAQLKERIWAVKEVLTTAEASAYLGLSESYIYKLTSLKQIPHYKPNGNLMHICLNLTTTKTAMSIILLPTAGTITRQPMKRN